MISSDKDYDHHAATKRMSDLVNKLSLEEQRILAGCSIIGKKEINAHILEFPVRLSPNIAP